MKRDPSMLTRYLYGRGGVSFTVKAPIKAFFNVFFDFLSNSNFLVSKLLFAYVFLLRVPSEALPAVSGKVNVTEAQSVLEVRGEQILLKLQKRKNRPGGSLLTRTCWCSKTPKACPIHVLGRGNFILMHSYHMHHVRFSCQQ